MIMIKCLYMYFKKLLTKKDKYFNPECNSSNIKENYILIGTCITMTQVLHLGNSNLYIWMTNQLLEADL